MSGRSRHEDAGQATLFVPEPDVPEGFRYREEFLDEGEERRLLAWIAELELKEAEYRQFTAKRRVGSFGGSYDFTHQELRPAAPVPEALDWLRQRVAAWTGISAQRYTHALVAEYRPGTQLGWHRDVPDFEEIAGVSLGARARMRLRPYVRPGASRIAGRRRSDTRTIDLEPRSIYSMSGVARWNWQHAISPTKSLRYSITLRTMRGMRDHAGPSGRRGDPRSLRRAR
jgi:alkylated DNA repair dioxygenase AlkB